MGEQPFRRSSSEFFHQSFTRHCLEKLSSATSLTIYCGAGVTIDRTGYGWGSLIGSVFHPDSSAHEAHPTPEEIETLQQLEDPLRLASVLTRFALDSHDPSELKRYLTPLLQNRLYRTRNWEAGLLARSVCELALAARTLGTEIDIVTTNYDTYLEESFSNGLRRLRATASQPSVARQLPGLKVWTYSDSDPDGRLETDALQEPEATSHVNLHYLHGRVPQSGQSSGTLVVSELDYAASRHRTAGVLGKYIEERRALLVMGASLTDPPLINALADSVPRVETDDLSRFVIMPRSSFSFEKLAGETNTRLVAHMARRVELLGARLIVPDFRFQVAQFCQELSHSIESDNVREFLSDASGNRYGLRLMAWWNQWKVSRAATEPAFLSHELSKLLKPMRALIDQSAAPPYGNARLPEVFRLELWVRADPTTRRLTMWGNTTGPLFDAGARRSANIELGSPNASVQTFTEGRPQLIESGALPGARAETRWESYFAVPYFARTTVGRIPVGVLTLASTAPQAESALPLANYSHMLLLRDALIHCGKTLLETPDPDQPSA